MLKVVMVLVRYFASLARRFIALVGGLIAAPMVKVFLVLTASLIAGPIADTDYFQIYLYEIDYLLYCTLQGSVYVLPAYLGLLLAKKEQSKGNNFSAILMLALCFCMVVTGLFNLVMVNHDVYSFINPFKSGDGFSWRNIYLSVEVVVAFIVGGNVFNYIASVDICPHGGSRGIIRDNDNNYTD